MKKDWVEEVGEKNGGCFDHAGGAGRLVSLSPIKVNLVRLFRVVRGVVCGVVRRVVRSLPTHCLII